MKARQIELYILAAHFDKTLEKYKPQPVQSISSPDITPKVTPTSSLAELWEKFVEYKRPQCSANTMLYVYKHFTNSVESCKQFIVRLNACFNWAVKFELIAENPFIGMANEIKPPKSQRMF